MKEPFYSGNILLFEPEREKRACMSRILRKADHKDISHKVFAAESINQATHMALLTLHRQDPFTHTVIDVGPELTDPIAAFRFALRLEEMYGERLCIGGATGSNTYDVGDA